MTRSLVAYFSATGTTEKLAKRIAEAADADLFQIVPAEPYSEADLKWVDKSSRSSREMADAACRPAIVDTVSNMDDYDVVFVGFPVWWYVEPRIIDTFLESYDFSGKRIVPFATSSGSPIGKAPAHIQSLCPGAEVVHGKRLNATDMDVVIFQWVAACIK